MGGTRSDRTPYSPLTVSVTVSVVGRVAAGRLPAGGSEPVQRQPATLMSCHSPGTIAPVPFGHAPGAYFPRVPVLVSLPVRAHSTVTTKEKPDARDFHRNTLHRRFVSRRARAGKCS